MCGLRGAVARRLPLALFFVVNDAVEIPGAFLKLPVEDGDLLGCGKRAAVTHVGFHAATGAGPRGLFTGSAISAAGGFRDLSGVACATCSIFFAIR